MSIDNLIYNYHPPFLAAFLALSYFSSCSDCSSRIFSHIRKYAFHSSNFQDGKERTSSISRIFNASARLYAKNLMPRCWSFFLILQHLYQKVLKAFVPPRIVYQGQMQISHPRLQHRYQQIFYCPVHHRLFSPIILP